MDSTACIRQQIALFEGKEVGVRAELGRKRTRFFRAVVFRAYPNVFTVKAVVDGTERMLTYSYNDIITRSVRLSRAGNNKE